MTAATVLTTPTTSINAHSQRSNGIPFSRIMKVELRKMFDTRSGKWMMGAVLLTALIATAAVIAFGGASAVTYENFGAAVGIPMTIVLPVISIMAISSEFSQRTALTTFTLVPNRQRVIGAKMLVVALVGVASILSAVAVGAVGNVLAGAIHGVDPVWNFGPRAMALIVLAQVLNMAFGFMFGVLFRNSPAAIVSYFAIAFVLAGLGDLLAAFQSWFADIRLWVDFNATQVHLFDDTMTSTLWVQLGVTTLFWVGIPLMIGIWRLMSAELH